MSGALAGFYLLQIYCLWSTGGTLCAWQQPREPQASTAAQWASTGGEVPRWVAFWQQFCTSRSCQELCVLFSLSLLWFWILTSSWWIFNPASSCAWALVRLFLGVVEFFNYADSYLICVCIWVKTCGLFLCVCVRESKEGGLLASLSSGNSKTCRSIGQSLSSSTTTSSGIDFQQMEAEL